MYCVVCQVIKDDALFGASVTLKRVCGSCGRVAVFRQLNARVIRCTFCNVRHEVGFDIVGKGDE